jgi:hypothetical protein
MNQELENNQPGVVIENPPGTSDIDVNNIEPPAQDLKHPDVDDSDKSPPAAPKPGAGPLRPLYR